MAARTACTRLASRLARPLVPRSSISTTTPRLSFLPPSFSLSPSSRLVSPPSCTAVRHAHSIPRPPAPRPPRDGDDDAELANLGEQADRNDHSDSNDKYKRDQIGLAPHYELTFTCIPCGTRSAHKVSKQGYHQGSVLIACPSCRNRHVISDHLGIFGGAKTLDDILAERGRLVKRGTLGEDGDLEFWEDGSSSVRQDRMEAEAVRVPSQEKKDDGNASSPAAPGSTFRK